MGLTSRRKRPLDRGRPHLRDTSLIVIATEGACTEKQYFEMFRHHRVQVKVLHTDDCKSAPEYVIERLKEYKRDFELGRDDELWLMVDVDSWGATKLADVAMQAVKAKFDLAVSNPCFELWLLLHHVDADSDDLPTQSKTAERLLRKVLGSYNKANLDTDQFVGRVKFAVEQARKLDVDQNQRWPRSTGTHVYRVIESIWRLMSTGVAATE